MASLSSENKLECKSMVLKLHTLFDIPRDLVSLDSRRENVELVLKPTAKYYSENKRFCKLDLPEHYVTFSPSSIIFKGDRFVLDFYSAPPQCGLTSAGRATSPQRASSFANSVPANATELYPSHGLTNTATPGVASSTGKMSLPAEADVRASGAAGLAAKSRNAFGDYTADDEHDVNLQSPANARLKPAAETTPAGAMLSNEITLRYPTRSDLKVIIEVMVGARQRRHDSSAVRWITPSWADRSVPGSISTFAAADGEVMRHKLVNRFVGLTVGHLSCTMELPYAADDLREVCAFKPTAMAEAAERLCDDYERLCRFHTHASEEQLAKMREKRSQRRGSLVDRLQSGLSEMTLYRALLLEVCPNYFTRRIRRICTMYPPTPQSSAWVRTEAEKLAEEHAGREMELIRSLCAELGPDLSAISPRNRFLSYTNVQPLGEELWRWIRENFANQENDILDYEPDVFMEALAVQYGTPEPTPIQYGFPPISYELDRRAYFCDSLRFPVNREHHRYRDEALAARQSRVPLQLTPCERPLHPIRPTSRNVGEIDILLEKYKPEFVQIVPSIADAMECVTQQNERLLQRLMRDAQAPGSVAGANGTREKMRSLPYEVCPHGFQLFQSERATGTYVALLNRFAEYTYISPSTLLSAVIYLDRLCLRHPRLLLTSRNIEKLLVAAVRVASKVVDLRSVNNKNFANVFSLMIQDMNDLESEFLKLMGFDFFLSPKEFSNYAHLVQLSGTCQQMSSSLRLSSTNLNPNAATAESQGEAARAGGTTDGGAGDAANQQDNDAKHTGNVNSGGGGGGGGTAGSSSSNNGAGAAPVRRSVNGRVQGDGSAANTTGSTTTATGTTSAANTASATNTMTSTAAPAAVMTASEVSAGRGGVAMQPSAPPPRTTATAASTATGTSGASSSAYAEDANAGIVNGGGNGGGSSSNSAMAHRPTATSPSVQSPTRASMAGRAAAAGGVYGSNTQDGRTAAAAGIDNGGASGSGASSSQTNTASAATTAAAISGVGYKPAPTSSSNGGVSHASNGYTVSSSGGSAGMTQAEFASGTRALSIA